MACFDWSEKAAERWAKTAVVVMVVRSRSVIPG